MKNAAPKAQNAAPKAQDADAKPYVPPLADAEAFKAYMAAREKAAPRLKVAPGAPITVDHPNKALGQIALMKAIGSTDDDFVEGLLKQLASAGSQGQKPDRKARSRIARPEAGRGRDQFYVERGEGDRAARSDRGDARRPDGRSP